LSIGGIIANIQKIKMHTNEAPQSGTRFKN